MKSLVALGLIGSIAAAFAADTMCVKQKDGTYKCKASGKIEKVPCCETPRNDPTPTPAPKKDRAQTAAPRR